MNSLHATSLSVASFRGIRRILDLSFGRRLTILYGGNATGKSSIAQSIEFALAGQVLDHQDNVIPARYLNNTHESRQGSVTLRLSDGVREVPLSARTDESRHQIEQQFRTFGSVDWPDRQVLPITTTHITSQGALARVLKADSVTRNDLAGLCAGATLRQMLSRAIRLSDYFRQASTGRNVQTSMREARAAYESARTLVESIASTRRPEGLKAPEPSKSIQELSLQLGLPDATGIEELASHVNERLEDAERSLASIERLLLRMRDIGQYEVESAQLQRAIDESISLEASAQAQKVEVAKAIEESRTKENEMLQLQSRALELIANHELYLRSVAALTALAERISETTSSLDTVAVYVASLTDSVSKAIEDQKRKSEALVSLESERQRSKAQLEACESALKLLASLDERSLSESRARLANSEAIVERLRAEETSSAADLRTFVDAESKAEHELKLISDSESRFVKATSELRAFINGDECSLCGHHHGSADALNAAIDEVSNTRLAASERQRRQAEDASAARRAKAIAHSGILARLVSADGALQLAREVSERLAVQHRATLQNVRALLTREGLQVEPASDLLAVKRDELTSRIVRIEQELEIAKQGDTDSRALRDDLEEDIAERRAEHERLKRLLANLQAQSDAIRSNQPASITDENVANARTELANSERELAQVRRNLGKASAEVAEIERRLSQSEAQRSGAKRRLEAIDGLLSNLDAELAAVGAATRDVSLLLSLEAETRRRRDESTVSKSRIAMIRQQMADLEQHRAQVSAESQFTVARATLQQLQQQQQHLTMRATQFATLQRKLESIQSATAEAVLRNVRAPVELMFRAMTAGCQWDIEFALTEPGQVEARLLGGLGATLPATAILNSAYLNVAAIALRIALASQQNWTSLRTIVLDDPILEMDSLTQSALIDGIEAILMSPHSPWNDLQIILTTWSEDFAILAAHKLAHLNHQEATTDRGDFVVYRLCAEPDGSVGSERHIPRWRERANAA